MDQQLQGAASVNGAVSQEEADAAEMRMLEAQLAAEDRALDAIVQRAEPTAIEAKRAELERKRRDRLNAETIERLVKEHGKLNEKIVSYGTPEGMLVVKRPSLLAYQAFIDGANPKTGASVVQMDALVSSCLIFPTREEYHRIRDAMPGVTGVLANLVLKLAGVKEVDIQGK